MNLGEFFKRRSDKKIDARSEALDKYWEKDFSCRFTLNGTRYLVVTETVPDLEERKLLELPTGEVYLVEWSQTSIPPTVIGIRRRPASMDISNLRSIVVSYDNDPDPSHHRRFRVD